MVLSRNRQRVGDLLDDDPDLSIREAVKSAVLGWLLMLSQRKGKRLPNGKLDEFAAETGQRRCPVFVVA